MMVLVPTSLEQYLIFISLQPPINRALKCYLSIKNLINNRNIIDFSPFLVFLQVEIVLS